MGAGGFLFSFFYFRSWPWFPSPCGVRRVRDKREGYIMARLPGVSVPLRGKEGAGPDYPLGELRLISHEFPSPCGVRRVRDGIWLKKQKGKVTFPSPCGVRRVRDNNTLQLSNKGV